MKYIRFQAQQLVQLGSAWTLKPIKVTIWDGGRCLIEDLVTKTRTLQHSFFAPSLGVSSEVGPAYSGIVVQKDTTEVITGVIDKHPILVPHGTFDRLLQILYEFPEENLLMI
jgi:hypothetical protein